MSWPSLRRAGAVGAVVLVVAGAAVAWVRTDASSAQVPTTLPTSPPTSSEPPTTAPPATERPTTTARTPAQTTEPPTTEAPPESEEPAGQPSPATSDRTNGASGGGVPGPDVDSPDALQLGETEDALVTTASNGRLPAIFPWLGMIGAFAFIGLLAIQWALTNPGRRGSRTL